MVDVIFGVGINDYSLPISKGRQPIIEYKLWYKMLSRCYSLNCHKSQPTYRECEVEPFLLSFTNFYNFIRGLKGFGEVDEKGKPFQMDKDLLVKGNKTYSVDTICFVPKEINLFLTNRKSCRGGFPIGVSLHKESGKYLSRVMVFNRKKHLGCFESPEEAFSAYKVAKEAQAKVLAAKWKDKIDPRVYDALMDYKISIDD